MKQQSSNTLEISDMPQPGFDDIFNLYYPRCVLFATKILGNRDEAEEVVQELFIKLWSNDKLSTLQGSLKSYLFKSVFNACIDSQRKKQTALKKTSDEGLTSEPVVAFQDPLLEEEIERAIQAAIRMLPEKRQQIFRMSREKGMSYQEIATELSLSAKTVETQMSRSLKHLRDSLSEYLPSVIF